MSTPRIERLKSALFESQREISLERALLYTESHKTTEGEHTLIRRAKATAYVLDNVEISIREDELIAPHSESARRYCLSRDGSILD